MSAQPPRAGRRGPPNNLMRWRPPPRADVAEESDRETLETRYREYLPEASNSETALIQLALDHQESVSLAAQAELLNVRVVKFFERANRETVTAMQALASRAEAINPITVFDELKRQGAVGDGQAFPLFADFQATYPELELAFTHDPHSFALMVHRAYVGRLSMEWGAKLAQVGQRNVPGEAGAALALMQMELSIAEREAEGDSAAARLRFLTLDDLMQRERAQMLDAEIQLRERQLALVYGASNSGKSLYVLMRLTFLAAGYLDGTPRHVAYLCGEGLEGIRDRLLGIIARFSLDFETVVEHLHILPDVPQLASPEDVTATIMAARELDEPLALTVIDTLATATEGINENASDEMGAALGGARRIGNDLACAVLLVHHAGKDETRGSRGWTGLPGKMDVSVEVTRAEGSNIVTLRCKKMRDGEYFADFAYRIVPWVLDEQGDVRTAVLQAGAPPAPRATRGQEEPKPLAPAQLTAWDVLRAAPHGTLRYGEWRTLCEIKGINRETFKSAQNKLAAMNRIAKDDLGRWVALPESGAGSAKSKGEGG